MTDAEMILLVSGMSGESNNDTVSAFLTMAGNAILNRAYPFVPDSERDSLTVPLRYQNLQCEIATFLLLKRGAEGETAHNENGINRSYENGRIPYSMLKEVVPYCAAVGGEC